MESQQSNFLEGDTVEFDFKVSKELGKIVEPYIYDIVYHARQSNDRKSYNISWNDPVSRTFRELTYPADTVNEFIDEKEWIII